MHWSMGVRSPSPDASGSLDDSTEFVEVKLGASAGLSEVSPPPAAPLIKDIRGRASLDVTVRGSLKSPHFSGHANFSDGLLIFEKPLPRLENVSCVLALDEKGLRIVEATAESGKEPLRIEGWVDLGGTAGEGPAFAGGTAGVVGEYHLRLSGCRVLLASDDTIRLRSDIDLSLDGRGKEAKITGHINPTTFGYFKDVRIDMEAPPPPPPKIPGVPGLNWVALEVYVRGSRNLMVSNNFVTVPFTANLCLGGTLETPVVTGQVSAERGFITLPTSEFSIERAVVNFPGAPDAQPCVELSAETDVGLTHIYLNAVGPLDATAVEVFSEPPHTQEDLLTLIAFGTTRERIKSGGAINIASYQFVRWLKKSVFGRRLPGEKPPSIFERLAIETEFKTGSYSEPIVRAQYRMGSKWSLLAEKDQYGDYNFDLQYRIKFK